MITLEDIDIRHDIRPGDLGFVVHRHGKIYGDEYDFGVVFEKYVAKGIYEFYDNYDSARDRVWVCEHNGQMIGFMLLMHRENNAAQLRYFYLEAAYRGIGLGKKLMQNFMDFLHECNYDSAYLWTTEGLPASAALYQKHGFTLTEEQPSDTFGKQLMERRYDWKKPI